MCVCVFVCSPEGNVVKEATLCCCSDGFSESVLPVGADDDGGSARERGRGGKEGRERERGGRGGGGGGRERRGEKGREGWREG